MQYFCDKCSRAFNTRMGRGVHQSQCVTVTHAAVQSYDINNVYDGPDDFSEMNTDGTFYTDEYDDYETFF
jgi:hypothetical protein